MGLRFEYPQEFERLWKAHPVGVKKPAFDAWKKLKLTADENAELLTHLQRRHKADVKWIEGKYVPHLSTFLTQRRWEDEYKTQRGGPMRETRPLPAEAWQRMGFASFEDYCNGRRMH
jgi:hypothetical protein